MTRAEQIGGQSGAAADFARARLAAEAAGAVQQRQAAQRVAQHCHDVQDCRDLLAMLGLSNLRPLTASGTRRTEDRDFPGGARSAPDDRRSKSMTQGTVKWFNGTKGFGFIAPEGGGPDVFVHHSEVHEYAYQGIPEKQLVEFDIQQADRGPQAMSVRLL